MQVAIQHAITILGWHENNASEDIPKRHLWDDEEGLAEHWKQVRIRMAQKYGVDTDEEVPDPDDMDENILTRELKRA